MRQRKIKDIENKLLDYYDLLIDSPEEKRGMWRSVFFDSNNSSKSDSECNENAPRIETSDRASDKTSDKTSDRKLFVEIGCGKGKFITSLAEMNPDDLFVAIEGFSSVIIRATDKARKLDLNNVRFILDFVFDLGTWFSDEEVDGIYLNFSDPWPKRKNAKRRLTYRDRLEQYSKALSSGGFIRIKTDNDGFFDFTIEEIEEYNRRCDRMGGTGRLDISALTRDLHNSDWANISPMTEYETKFKEAGKNINFVELIKK